MEMLRNPGECTQVRAALGGHLKAGTHTEVWDEYGPWLHQSSDDFLWYIRGTRNLGRRQDMPHCVDGERLILPWKTEGTRVNLLSPSKMTWVWKLTVDPHDLMHQGDLVYDRPAR